MGLLDDLKQQAERQKQQQESGQAVRGRNLERIHAALGEAYRYLNELAKTFNAVKPQVHRSFYVDPSTKLDQLAQCDYTVRDKRKTLDHKDYLEEVKLLFRSVGNQNLTIEKDSPQNVERLREQLWSFNFKFECKEFKNERAMIQRGTFTVFADVPASATFAGDLDTGKIKLTLKNIEKAGDADYFYEAAEVNEALLEEFAKLLIGKPNNFRNLGNYQEMMRTTTVRRPTA
jgi:hypothetical protein